MKNNHFALITGASSGIGLACAWALAAEGKSLILVARRRESLEELKKEIESKHAVKVLVYAFDLADSDSLNSFFQEIEAMEIDVLINNAGLALNKQPFDHCSWEDFDQMIEVNIKAFTRVAQLSIPHLKRTKGHIVNMSSIAGVEAYEGGSVYCASKAFVKMISKSLRIDLHGSGVRVTDIAPGNVETEFSKVRFKGDEERAEAVYQGYQPLSAQDIADTVLFALKRPPNVNIEYLLIMPTAQASAGRIYKEE